ncbi:MAG: hypothetical protein IJ608_08310 [Lachnospiraceae bacterium]|nr:hypothetical protein [Lachnospiraceae bacterium]
MKLIRLFSSDDYKGEHNYIRNQRRYEIARTVIYFGISAFVFVLGIIYTKTRMNLLTLVAVLGCLPACKSLVSVIMFCRFKGCSEELYERLKPYIDKNTGLFDMVFTSYDKNYETSHILVADKTILGLTENASFDENGFKKHISARLSADGVKDEVIKIFKDTDKYIERIKNIDADSFVKENPADDRIIKTLKAVSL